MMIRTILSKGMSSAASEMKGRPGLTALWNRARRLLGLMFVAALLTTSTGCNKLLANLALNQAQENVAEARENNAEQFDPEGLAAAESAISAAQNYINAGQTSEARTQARDAAEASEQLLERVINARANFLKSEANRWRGIMDRNQAKAENAQLYQEIENLYQVGLAEFDEGDYEDSIVTFAKVVDDSQFLLENLRRTAEASIPELEEKRQDLVQREADEYYPEGVIQLERYLTNIQDQIEDKYDYRTAILLRDQAIQSYEESIQRTKENKSDRLLRRIEGMLSEAVTRGAEIYAPQTLEAVTRDFEDLLKQFYEQKYDTVLTTGPNIIPDAENLLTETKRESARAKINALEEAIASLTEKQTKIYLPGRVEQLEEVLASAREDFEAGNYEETERKSLEGIEQQQAVILEFDSLTQGQIANANAALTIANSVFGTMEEVFAQAAPAALTSDARAVQNTKTALQEELRAKLQNSSLELGVASLKREEQAFNEAIEIAQKVIADSEDVVQQTYHVVSNNTVQELAAELKRLEREGARQYVPEAVQVAEASIDEIRSLIDGGDYRAAVERAADAKAELELLEQQLTQIAVAKVEQAEEHLAQARSYRGEEFTGQEISQIQQLVTQSQQNLDSANLKDAIDGAEQAQQTAVQAGEESMRQWAEEEMRRADEVLNRARNAGASNNGNSGNNRRRGPIPGANYFMQPQEVAPEDPALEAAVESAAAGPGEVDAEIAELTGYAAELMTEAEQLRRRAEGLFQAGNFVEAQSAAAQAAELAERALYARVIAAEDAIAEARAYDAWEYNPTRLAEAIMLTEEARRLLDAGDFAASHTRAVEALRISRDVTREAREASFAARLAALEQRVELARSQGAAYFQVRDIRAIVAELEELEAEFEPENLEEAQDRLDLLEARLAAVIETTPQVLQELIANLTVTLEDLEDRNARTVAPDAVAEAAQKIRFAQLDFRNDEFRSAFVNVRRAVDIMSAIEAALVTRQFERELGEYMIQFTELVESYAPVLEAGSTMMVRLIRSPSGRQQAVALTSAASPVELRQAFNDMGAEIALMPVPPGVADNLKEPFLDMLRLAERSMSKFEKLLIIDQYHIEEAREIIETAFLDMSAARDVQRDIQGRLENVLLDVRQVGVERVY